MRPDVLSITPLIQSAMETLESEFTVHRYWEAEDKAALLAKIGPDLRAITTSGHTGCPDDVLAAAPNLGLISSFGVGYDGVDTEGARARGIKVTNTPDVLNDAMAEITIGLMIGLCRQMVQADAYVRAGKWKSAGNYPLTAELTGRTVGILGLGRIGKEIAKRCQAMKMQVVYHGRSHQPHEPYPYYADLMQMARDVDWLVVIAPGSPETDGIVSDAVLEALGPQGMLVNVARGTLIDEAAMVRRLSDGSLGGAALDVFEKEPHVPEELFALDNVLLSPHQGSATHKTRAAMGDLVVRNVRAFFAGKPLISPVV